jgi:hypothetical protein
LLAEAGERPGGIELACPPMWWGLANPWSTAQRIAVLREVTFILR